MPSEQQIRPGHVHQLNAQGVTIEHAIDHLVDAATGVVKSQLELARLDLQATMRRVLRSGALVVVGTALIAGACVALALLAYAMFPDHVPPEQRLAILAAVSGASGIGLALVGVRHLKSNGVTRSHGGH
jgi:hypothetical protein